VSVFVFSAITSHFLNVLSLAKDKGKPCLYVAQSVGTVLQGESFSLDPEVFLRHPAFGGRRSAGPKGRINPCGCPYILCVLGFILEKCIPFFLLIVLFRRFFLHLEERPFGSKKVAEVPSLFVSDPFCLWLFAFMICFLVVEIAIIATAQIGPAMGASILPLNLLP
jgi:hypothetical protein